MKFDIKCATFLRLAKICDFFEPTTPHEIKQKINTVRFEIVNGKLLAIATNQKIAAIELIGFVPGPNGVAHVIITPALINQCRAEAFMDGTLSVNTIPEIASAILSTSSGWSYPGNGCYWFDDSPLNDWRKWAPDEPITRTEYVMWWNLYHIQALMESSPSGKVFFPKYIDASKPVVLRDVNNANWVGLFVPKPSNTEIHKTPAELPEWWRN